MFYSMFTKNYYLLNFFYPGMLPLLPLLPRLHRVVDYFFILPRDAIVRQRRF
jgi:hypothetical protein